MPQTTPRDQGGRGARRSAPRSCSPATATPTPRRTATRSWRETGMTFIHPFDDPLVIAGQGTIGAEILRHSQDRLVGGLRAGRRRRADRRHRRLHQGAAARRASHRRRAVRGRRDVPLARGRPARARSTTSASSPTASRCARSASRRSRSRSRPSTRSCASRNDEICAAIKDIFDDTRSDHGAGRRAGGRRAEDVGRARAARATSRSSRC